MRYVCWWVYDTPEVVEAESEEEAYEIMMGDRSYHDGGADESWLCGVADFAGE